MSRCLLMRVGPASMLPLQSRPDVCAGRGASGSTSLSAGTELVLASCSFSRSPACGSRAAWHSFARVSASVCTEFSALPICNGKTPLMSQTAPSAWAWIATTRRGVCCSQEAKEKTKGLWLVKPGRNEPYYRRRYYMALQKDMTSFAPTNGR